MVCIAKKKSLTSKSLGFKVRFMDISKAAAVLGKKGGSAKTRAKVRASKINGKLGGRPKKKIDKRLG
jgi:hypothetical protein